VFGTQDVFSQAPGFGERLLGSFETLTVPSMSIKNYAKGEKCSGIQRLSMSNTGLCLESPFVIGEILHQ